MNLRLSNALDVVEATFILHNFLLDRKSPPFPDRESSNLSRAVKISYILATSIGCIEDAPDVGNQQAPPRTAKGLRETLKEYLDGPGFVLL